MTPDQFKILIAAIGNYEELYNQRKLTPAENIERKLVNACLDGKNRRFAICNNMPGLINAAYNDTRFTHISEFALDDYYQTHGYFNHGNISLTGNELQPIEAIFTNPQSQAYCVQSIFIDQIVPQPRPKHDYPQNDLYQLLKFRLADDTHICQISFPDYYKPSDIAYRIGNHLTGRATSRKGLNPQFTAFTTIFETLVTISNQHNLTFAETGKAVMQAKFGNSSHANITATVQQNLQNISRIHLLMATEPKRMGWADSIVDIQPIQKLWVIAKFSLCEIRLLRDVLTKKTRADFLRLGFENENSFDRISANDLRVLELLVDLTGSITHALNWFSSCHFDIVEIDMETGKTYFGDKELIYEYDPVIKKLVSYRNTAKSRLDIALLKDILPESRVDLFQLNDMTNKTFLMLLPAAQQHINEIGKISFLLNCTNADMLIGNSYKYNLGRIERPKKKEVYESRQKKFLAKILTQKFNADLSAIFVDNFNATLPTNTLDFLLRTANLDPIIYLDFYDDCERLSPLSAYFQPNNEHDYDVSFGYEITLIQQNILSLCTLQNAVGFMYAWTEVHNIHFIGRQNDLDRCIGLAADSGRGGMHDFLVDYLPDNMHSLEHDVQQNVENVPPIYAMMLITFTIAMALFCRLRPRRRRLETLIEEPREEQKDETQALLPKKKLPSIRVPTMGSRFFKPTQPIVVTSSGSAAFVKKRHF